MHFDWIYVFLFLVLLLFIAILAGIAYLIMRFLGRWTQGKRYGNSF